MCGIAGIYKFHNQSVHLDELKKMTDIINYRGPDGDGHWINAAGHIGFGHRRLSIIDLSENGKQPMHYANGRYTMTFNGEIYNYIELKEQLVKEGFEFHSNSDTEVLLALYHLKQEKCLDEMDGMFAFAIWDEQEKKLFCARDRFGEKPFHYYHDNESFAFASEIKQFWTVGIKKELDQNKLLHYAQTGIIDDIKDPTTTYFKNIKRLDAAHYLTITADKKLTIHKYWDIDLNAKPFTGTIEQASKRFLELFTESIRLRLRSDVPVGSSLSGGIDSSSIVMIIDSLKEDRLEQNTFSARFKNFRKDEGAHIEEVVKACKNLKVHYTWPDKEYFERVFDKVTYHQEEPYHSASQVAQYAVMELAKAHNVTVLQDGQGADEQLAGYLFFYHTYLHQLFYSKSALYETEYIAYQKYHEQALHYTPVTEAETIRMKLGRHKRTLLKQEMPFKNQLNIHLKNSTTSVGLKDLLRYGDRNSMAHSREVRLPFLSHKLVEFIFSLPNEFKINNGWTKFVLRKAMDGLLPQSICWRIDKIGYEPPQRSWIESEAFTGDIERASKFLNIKRLKEINPDDIFTQDWRLLLSSKFI
jgi:asparagine synthase (glutamine-hydrolysing)